MKNKQKNRWHLWLCLLFFGLPLQASASLSVAVGKTDLTPPQLLNPNSHLLKNHPVWIAGFGRRQAKGVHDPIEGRVIVIRSDHTTLVLITLDLIGLLKNRVAMIQESLAKDGFNPKHILVASTHTHQGPDTIGMWGESLGKSGLDGAYLDWLVQKVVTLVQQTAKKQKKAKVAFGQVAMRKVSPYFNGRDFGGKNPKRNIIGLLNDIRDPVIVDDELLVMQFQDRKGHTIATLMNWSGHPEVVGSENDQLSADYVGYFRRFVEREFGGTALFFASDVGGMMSALGTPIPDVDQEEHWIWTKKQSPRFVLNGFRAARALGFHLAQGVKKALDKAKFADSPKLIIQSQDFTLPISNKYYLLGEKAGIFEIRSEKVKKKYGCKHFCIPTTIYHIRFGDAEIVTVPGEILPELVVPLPENFLQSGERPNRYFPQHNEKKPLSQHANPFQLSFPPLKTKMSAPYRFLFGLTDNEIGYIVPPADFNRTVYALGKQGDHYEETNSIGEKGMRKLLRELHLLLERTK